MDFQPMPSAEKMRNRRGSLARRQDGDDEASRASEILRNPIAKPNYMGWKPMLLFPDALDFRESLLSELLLWGSTPSQ